MNERTRLERIRRWRQAAVWAPVFWFPVILTGFALGHFAVALTLALAGFVFAGICGAVVWLGRCPRCNARLGMSSKSFRRIRDAATCDACGLSLFELRRRDGSSP